MEEYSLYFAMICLFLAAYVLIKGVAAAYRQGHGDGSVSLFPPPAYGVVASVLLTVGLGFFRLKLPWWGFRIIFPGTTLLFPAILYIIGRRPPQDHTRLFPKGQ
jgi:hypothetical protein